MAAGLALQAVGMGLMALVIEQSTPYVELIGPFAITGIGMALVFPTAPEAVLAAVRPSEAGKASGATNAIREVGAVLGVAVLATVFAANGGYESPQAFADGVAAALPVAVAVLAAGALIALLVPRHGAAHAIALEPAPA
jgi:MFS family permease